MSTLKAEKEKLQLIQEKSQQILSELLKDEDNKYCVDCDAKGPRWASWNLGVFLCIRCAGVHRNLGVHISKVKSVNLDSWSPEQVAYMQLMGNSKARAVYEANLPDNFKRPQGDSGLEAFVRSKYEHKKYIAKEWVEPPTPKPAFDIEEERKKDKEKKRNKIVKGQTNSTIIEVQTNPVPRPHSSPAGTAINAEKVLTNNKNGSNGTKSSNTDLLGLNTSSAQKNQTSDDDQFDAFVSCAPVGKADELVNIQSEVQHNSSTKTNEEEDFFSQKMPEQKKLDKESILKLYESSNLNQGQNNFFGLSNSTPLQPMNIATNGFSNASGLVPTSNQQPLANNLFNSPPLSNNGTNVINNGFANFNNHKPANQQPFLAFNQQPATVQPAINNNSTNPFLITPQAPQTNGTSLNGDLFSSNVNTNLSTTTLESQLNGLKLNKASESTINWSSSNSIPSNNLSIGQSLFSANFDCLNEKKLNGISASTTNPPAVSAVATNPFLSANSTTTTAPLQANNLDIFSAFNTSTTSATTNGSNNDSEGWSSFHSASATTKSSLTTADIWP